jgi:cytochrome c oxidase subunit III
MSSMSTSTIAIPYTTESHPDTGLYNAKFGMWLFLASEIMLFGALFSGYILLRTGATEWPVQSQTLNLGIGSVNTAILLSSSMTMLVGWDALRRGDFGKFRAFLGLTILLAVAFLGFKGFEYFEHFHHHEYPKKSIFLSLYYLMTGVHALHVLGGITVNSYLWGPGSRMHQTDPRRFLHRIEVAGLYWNFVDIVWIFIFITLYIL